MAPSADGLTMVGRRVQVLMDAISDLRSFRVEHVVPLPNLVLVGDQSAGKSSLMGALAEIHLPRSAGCCTRCPAHIKTNPAETWSCKVSLEIGHTYKPRTSRPLDPRDVTKNDPFPPWVHQDELVIKPFKTITRKIELEEVLRWAQVAILNPTKNHENYIPGSETFTADERTETKFSPNAVKIEISGPGLVSLTFYDLPGVFQNAGQKEDQYLVKVIENLAGKYISAKKALVICALPMSADAATSRTAKIISDLGAEARTIGVLTKADQLQEGQGLEDFSNMLNGLEHKIGHGYYVTKLPGGAASRSFDDDYHIKARLAEERFFAQNSPFNDEWAEFRSRFGTTNLAHALSQKFAAAIVDAMPEVEYQIQIRAREIDLQLSQLPELPTANVLHIVLQSLGKFVADFQQLLDGGSYYNEFQSSWRVLCKQFRDTIMAMKPKITIAHASDTNFPGSEVVTIDDDDDASVISITPNNSPRKRLNDQSPSPRDKKPRIDGLSFSSGSLSSSFESRRGSGSGPAINGALAHRFATPMLGGPVEIHDNPSDPFVEFRELGKSFASIGEIQEMIAQYSRTGVPNIVNDMVYDKLCMMSVCQWNLPLERMVDHTMSHLRKQADDILVSILSKWQQTQLFRQSRDLLGKFFDDFETTQRAAMTELYELESYRLFTINEAAFETHIKAELALLEKAREERRAKAQVEATARMTGKPFKDEAAKKHATQQLLKSGTLTKDPFSTEINVAAYVRGYYMTAGLRFADMVCLSIHGKLFKEARARIFYYLEHELGLDQANGKGTLFCPNSGL